MTSERSRSGRRRVFACAGMLVAAPIAAVAQQRTRPARIGVLVVPSAAAPTRAERTRRLAR
jgi:hypothetical protein